MFVLGRKLNFPACGGGAGRNDGESLGELEKGLSIRRGGDDQISGDFRFAIAGPPDGLPLPNGGFRGGRTVGGDVASRAAARHKERGQTEQGDRGENRNRSRGGHRIIVHPPNWRAE